METYNADFLRPNSLGRGIPLYSAMGYYVDHDEKREERCNL